MKKPPSIFEDLEIDTTDMLNEPEAFAARVVAKAKELEAILKSDTSVASYEKQVREQAKGQKISEDILPYVNDIYEIGETASLEDLVHLIDLARNLVKDLETAFHSRAVYESTRKTSPIADKRVAHAQHVKLRKAYDGFRQFCKLFNDYNPPVINGQSGNFGSNLSPLKTYIFEIDGDEFMNHFPVIRRLGKVDELTSLMDLLEYLEENPDSPVTVREVSF